MTYSQDAVEERRHQLRLPLTRQASFEQDDGTVTGHVVDISFFGALFEMDADHVIATKAGTLVVPFSRDPQESIEVVARVVYRRDRSVGLSWDCLGPENIMKVRRLSEAQAGRPWLLARPAHTLFSMRRQGAQAARPVRNPSVDVA